MKTAMTSVDLAAAVAELRDYEGAVVDKSYLYPDDTARIRLRHHELGRTNLMIGYGDVKRFHLSDDPPDAPERPPELAKLLRSRLSGASLVGVEQHDFDRVVTLTGERSDGAPHRVVAELFGDGNLAVLDDDGRVLRSARTVRLSSRTVAQGEPYEAPPQRADPLALDLDGFVDAMEQSDTDLVRTLASQLNLGGLYAEELCLVAGLDKETPIADATEEDHAALHDAIAERLAPVADGDLDPRIVLDAEGDPEDVVPIPLERYADRDVERYDRFHDALDDYFAHVATAGEGVTAGEDADGDGAGGGAAGDGETRDERIARQERIVQQQENAIEDFDEQEDRLRAKAETLYAHYGTVDEVIGAVRDGLAEGREPDAVAARLEEAADAGNAAAAAVEAVRDGAVDLALDDLDVTVEVDDGVEANASRLYEEAKHVAEKRAGAEEALEESLAELERLRNREAGFDAADDADGGDEDAAEGAEGDDGTTVRPRDDAWYHRFRWFHTHEEDGDGYLVIGGRDSDQNEELIKKYLEPHDLFYHTQARGAPITVLKTTAPDESAPDGEPDVPEASREQAATFAATYSQLWKQGVGSAEVYEVWGDQVSKTPESGEYVEKGSAVVRGDRIYRTVALDCTIGLRLDGQAGVIGGPSEAVLPVSAHHVRLEPGEYAPGDAASKIYRHFREVAGEEPARRYASTDEIQRFLPAGGSRLVEER